VAIVFDTQAELEAFLEAFELREIQHGQTLKVNPKLVDEPESTVDQPELEVADVNLSSLEQAEPVVPLINVEEIALSEGMAELPIVWATAS